MNGAKPFMGELSILIVYKGFCLLPARFYAASVHPTNATLNHLLYITNHHPKTPKYALSLHHRFPSPPPLSLSLTRPFSDLNTSKALELVPYQAGSDSKCTVRHAIYRLFHPLHHFGCAGLLATSSFSSVTLGISCSFSASAVDSRTGSSL